jgi:subtilisin family serine protease
VRRPLLLLVIAALGGLLPTSGGASSSRVTLLVTTDGQVSLDVAGAQRVADRVYAVDVPATSQDVVAGRLRAAEGVLAVERDGGLETLARPNDAQYGEQWSHALTGIETAWGVTTGKGTTVALLDTGVNGAHPDLAANLLAQVDVSSGVAANALNQDNDSCGLGHGTQVAGVVAAVTNNGRDIAGSAWNASLVDVAVTGTASKCRMTDKTLVAGIAYAASRGDVDVINVSLGRIASSCPTAVQAAVDDARARGVTIVAAAGNVRGASGAVGAIPASCNGVVSVGAVGADGLPASYSTANRWVDLVAPGGDDDRGVLTLSTDLGVRSSTGTSFAAAYVSGVATLVGAARPASSPADIEAFLEGTASDLGEGGRDARSGWGLVQAGAAVTAARAGTVPTVAAAPAFPVADAGAVRLTSAQEGAVGQGLVLSRTVFGTDEAEHAVLARADDYADALSGASLAGAQGPVLFTNRTGSLPAQVRDELRRVLPDKALVYILGGTSALPASLEAEVAAVGLTPRRLAGATREATSAKVAAELVQRRASLDLPSARTVVLATSHNWPDATIAASLGALTGAPVLLTAPNGLDPTVADAMAELRPSSMYVVGGTAAVDEPTSENARRAGNLDPTAVVRLAGTDRITTAVKVATETESLIRSATGAAPALAVAVNVRRSDGYAYVLAAAPLLAVSPGLYLPVDGNDGSVVPDAVLRYACGLASRSVIDGGLGVVTSASANRLATTLAGSC